MVTLATCVGMGFILAYLFHINDPLHKEHGE
jgi:hypothetical protein